MYRSQLHWQPIVVLIILALIWGANMAMVKIGARELPSLFMAGFRSVIASICLFLWMKAKGMVIFPSKIIILHGIVVGLMFGSEFGLIYLALEHSPASRVYIWLYTAPFFAALGAHFFLQNDRFHVWKSLGLFLAFGGVVILFVGGLRSYSLDHLPGDIMALISGAVWGLTTVYIKRYLAHRTAPLQTLFYQLVFSIPLLLFFSLILEDFILINFSPMTWFSIFYQCIIVAFLSYLAWFELIHRYPISLLHAFSFFTPVFGVFLSGALILGEIIHPSLFAALVLVSVGMVLVNFQPKTKSEEKP
ncbi:MAG: DMT family transporter [Deltaproteobacteria bacterium]|nr:DMT family transporter [Deltaproteobacteria bacterium]